MEWMEVELTRTAFWPFVGEGEEKTKKKSIRRHPLFIAVASISDEMVTLGHN